MVMVVRSETAGFETADSTASWALVLAAVLGMAMLGIATTAAADPCVVPEGPPGTVTLPPAGCDYLSPDEVHLIIDGLPPDTTIELAPIHKDFICYEQLSCTTLIPPGECEAAGGSLGGNGDCFDSSLQFQLTGTGALAGFSRLITVFPETEIHTGPRNPGDPVQTFPTEMFRLQADLFGDPDFAQLNIRAGSSFGLPSPGSTTLTDLGDGTFNVDSFFDVSYEIDFVGAPGSVLDGMAGTTQATLRMQAGQPVGANPCEVPDNGGGTVTLPPAGCEYLSPDEVHMILNDLPPGTTIELAAIHKDFICRGQGVTPCSIPLPPLQCEDVGGSLGGNVDCFDSVAELDITGTGALGSFQRTIFVPLGVEVHTGPRNPGDPVQTFPNEMVSLQGQLFGDPDFDQLTITAGSNHGLPSPGQTTLTRLGPPGSNFAVDSFFDISYQIDFQGAPGGQLDGLSGTTQGSIRMQTGDPQPPLINVPALPLPWLLAIAGMLAVSGGFVLTLLRRGIG
jgi:hypothetical protein